jgi:hypothetical protein
MGWLLMLRDPRLIIAALVLAASCAAVWRVAAWRLSGDIARARMEATKIQAEASAKAAEQAEQKAQRAVAAADAVIESLRRDKAMQDEEVARVKNQRADLERRVALGRANGLRLRDAVYAAAAACRGGDAPASALASGSEAATSAPGMLADVLGSVEQRGRAMAEEADRRRLAALACEALSKN